VNSLKNPIENRINPRMFESEPLQRCCLDECSGACCVFGVWIDVREVEDILNNADVIRPFMPEDLRDPGVWFVPVEDNDERSPSGKVLHTAVEPAPWHYGETACIFCREGGKCSLQTAAMANHLHPWRFKPYYCILHPLDLDEQGRITLDTREALLTEKGSCVKASEQNIPIIEPFTPELEYLLGEKAFSTLLELAAQKKTSAENVRDDDANSAP
jgi:hypothetical protein